MFKSRTPEERKKYNSAYYIKNRSQIRRNKRIKRDRIVSWIRSLKRGPCKDCGHSFHPAAMQFDHVKNNKIDSISALVERSLINKKVILNEIKKCELVCANCHAIRTFNRREKKYRRT